MICYSRINAEDVARQIIGILQERGSAPIEMRVVLRHSRGATIRLTCAEAGEYADLNVSQSYQPADIEGGMMPGRYWSRALRQQDWQQDWRR